MKRFTAFLAVLILASFSFGQLGTVSVKTADYAVLPTDHGSIIVMNSASSRTVYLPGPSPAQIGMTVTIQKRGTGNVTIQAAGADYIADSGVGQYIRNSTAGETYASITLVYAQANRWQIQAASGTWATDTSAMKFGADIVSLLALKAPLASPAFTGTVTLPTSLSGYVKAAAGVVSAGSITNGDLPTTIASAAPVVTKATDATLSASELNSIVYVTATGTMTLPDTSTLTVGTWVTIVSTTAAAVHVDPNAADLLIVDGVAFTAGQKASSSSGAGDLITFQYYTAGKWMMVGRSGAWTNGG